MNDTLSHYFSVSLLLIIVTMLFQIFSLSDKGAISETKKKWISIFFLAFIAIATAVEKSSDQKRMDDLTSNNKALLSITNSTKLLVNETKSLASTTDSTTNKISEQNDSLVINSKNQQKTLDSFKLLQKGTILITPKGPFVEIDTQENQLHVKFKICNAGSTVARNVSIVLKEISDSIRTLATVIHNFSSKPDCWYLHTVYPLSNDVYKYKYLYEISYKDIDESIKHQIININYENDVRGWVLR